MQHDRQIFQPDLSAVPQETVLEAIELLGTGVLPLVQQQPGYGTGTEARTVGRNATQTG